MSIENRENQVEGLISRETMLRLSSEKRLLKRYENNPAAILFSAASAMAVAKRFNPEAAKNLGLF